VLRVAEYFHATDLGRQRTGNEDSHFARAPLFVVADGMGGAQAGEVASQEATATFDGGLPDGDAGKVLERLIHEANERIHRMSQERTEHAGMGTTLTAAYVTADDQVVVAHVGDSRCYLYRGGELSRLTNDHTLVEELVRRGKLTPEQAEVHPQRSVITRALGPYPQIEVDVDAIDAKDGDVFLLCSDGLTSMVPETRVRAALEIREASLEQLGRGLIEAANTAGGRDNITVILFRLESTDGEPADAEEADTRVGDAALRTGDVAAAVRDAEQSPNVAVAEPPRRTAPLPSSAAPPKHDTTAGQATPRRRRRRLRVPGWVILLAVLASFVLAGGWMASRAVYFLGTDPGDGRTIVLFRGLPYELPGGVELYEEVAPSGLTIDAVPASRRAQFTNHKLRSRQDAEGLLAEAEKGRLVE
jgi:serine/threonine protein phosphatase PrpC